jgi:voltage-gated sodium channel
MRKSLGNWIESPAMGRFITWVILFNAVILGLETSAPIMTHFGGVLHLLDAICLAIFVVELAIKLYAQRLKFFTNGWNLFDFVVIGFALVPAGQGLAVLRALRILRVLRVVSVAPSLRRVVEGFVTALPGMGSVFLLMAIIFYIGAVIATKLFGPNFPEWFGTLGMSAYTLFQVMTLESWSMGIVRPVMAMFPYAWVFFVPFIMITTFAVVNLLVGLIVNSMQDAHAVEDNEKRDARHEELADRLARIETMLQNAQGRVDGDSSKK